MNTRNVPVFGIGAFPPPSEASMPDGAFLGDYAGEQGTKADDERNLASVSGKYTWL